MIRVGPIVYKILRDAKHFESHKLTQLRMTAAETIARWQRMADQSIGRPPLNPMLYVDGVFVSRFVDGRHATGEELQAVVCAVNRYRLGISDFKRQNCVVGADGPVLVDWL